MAQTNQELIRHALIGYQQEKQRIEEKIAAIRAQLGGSPATERNPTNATAKKGGRRNLSAAARQRIAAAQKARWAAYRGETVPASQPEKAAPAPVKKKQAMSAEGRARIAEAQQKRWAKAKKS